MTRRPTDPVPGPARWSHRFDVEILALACLAAAFVGIWQLSHRLVAQQRSAGEQAVVAEARTGAARLADGWQRTLHRVALVQADAADAARAGLTRAPAFARRLDTLRREIDIAGPGLLAVSARDAAGATLWSVRLAHPPVPGAGEAMTADSSADDAFRQIADSGQDHAIGAPMPGPDDGQWHITLARGIWDAPVSAGDALTPARLLRAVTLITLDPQAARDPADHGAATDTRIGPGDLVSLVRTDGLVLASTDMTTIGARLRIPPLAGGPTVAAARTPDHVDTHVATQAGSPRTELWRPVDDATLLLVGLDEARRQATSTQIETWTQRSALVMAGAAMLLATALLGALRHRRGLREERLRTLELAHREALLRQIAERAADLIALHDEALRTIYTNPAHRTLLGFDPASLIGQDFTSFVLPEDAEAVDAEITAQQHEGGTRRLTYRARHASGRVLWLETEMVAIAAPPGADAGAVRAISISRDITRRMQNQQTLRETQQQMAALLRLGPGVLYRRALSVDGSQLAMEIEFPAAPAPRLPGLRAWGLEVDGTVAADRFEASIHAADRDQRARAIARCLRTGQAVVEYRQQDPAGAIHWLRDEMRIAAPDPDTPRAIVGYLTDVSAEHDAKARLAQAERLASLGEMATAIAHEMNVPLATIAMAAENGLRHIERGHGADGSVAGKLRRIIDQAGRVGRVIEHVRLFGRGQPAEASEFALIDVVRDALLLTQSRIDSAALSVSLDLPEGLARLHLAPMLLEQVLMNLIVNAADAYDERNAGAATRQIRIGARQQGGWMVVSLADQAGGIPPAVIERVFDPFFTTKPPGKGTGLGLSISFAAVAEMGGQIRVRNEAGGALFEIELPITSDQPATAPTVPA